MFKVLIVDDDPTFCLMLKSYLGNKGFDVKEVFSAGSALKVAVESNSTLYLPTCDCLILMELSLLINSNR
jgi:CheY-like chemotaxis protein